MSVRDESLYAYQDINNDGTANTQRAVVLAAVRLLEPCSRAGVSKYTKLPINCITGRINELIKSGRIFEYGRAKSPSGRLVNILWTEESRNENKD